MSLFAVWSGSRVGEVGIGTERSNDARGCIDPRATISRHGIRGSGGKARVRGLLGGLGLTSDYD